MDTEPKGMQTIRMAAAVAELSHRTMHEDPKGIVVQQCAAKFSTMKHADEGDKRTLVRGWMSVIDTFVALKHHQHINVTPLDKSAAKLMGPQAEDNE